MSSGTVTVAMNLIGYASACIFCMGGGSLAHLLVPGFAQQLKGLLLCGLGFGHSGQLGRPVQCPGHRSSMESGCLGRLRDTARAVMCLRSSLRIKSSLIITG